MNRVITNGVALMLSTAHVSRDDLAKLRGKHCPYGLAAIADTMYIPPLRESVKYDKALKDFGFTEAFRSMLLKLMGEGYKHVSFDTAAPRYQDFQRFDRNVDRLVAGVTKIINIPLPKPRKVGKVWGRNRPKHVCT